MWLEDSKVALGLPLLPRVDPGRSVRQGAVAWDTVLVVSPWPSNLLSTTQVSQKRAIKQALGTGT